MFSGQGAQQVGMGQSLYQEAPVVAQLYDQANEILGFDLKGISFAGPEAVLTETRYCQPALFVHGYSIFKLLEDKGLLEEGISAALGLSLGELTALSVAEVFDFETGLRLVAERGRLMQEACEEAGGSMAALIGGGREEASDLARRFDLDVANFNCPGQIVISGNKAAIGEAVAAARDSGFKLAKELNVAGAYHSRLMIPARERFASAMEQVAFKAPRYPVYTNTTGESIVDPAAIKTALAEQITGSVYFEDNMRNAAAETGNSVFFECGPGGVLAGFAKRIDRSFSVRSFAELEDFAS